ncbi:MAG: putative RNA-binding protein [Sedimentibacter sp.]|nr:putative RNA-binding protein [Sedimentibacter sp.]
MEARELIKIKLLNNSQLEAKQIANEIAESVRAEFVQSIGNKFVLYREAKEAQIVIPK